MLKQGTVAGEDLSIIRLTDDPEEVLTIMREHRDWKRQQMLAAAEKLRESPPISRGADVDLPRPGKAD
ncbi:MAG: hypothetical protein PHP86_09650 [Nevskiales bacterium]|nr:hypothetical protein [Nevskiales bacterium]